MTGEIWLDGGNRGRPAASMFQQQGNVIPSTARLFKPENAFRDTPTACGWLADRQLRCQSRGRRDANGRHVMILGMSASTFTLVHVVLSLVGIASGIIVVLGMLGAKRLDGWTALFLATTVLTSVTGFLFPADRLLPSHIFGIISLVVLAAATFALYGYRLSRPWRLCYVGRPVLALYLNAFLRVLPGLHKCTLPSPLT